MSTDSPESPSIEFLLDVPIQLNAELGTCAMTCRDLLKLDIGSVVQLDKPAHASVNLYVNTKLVARGEVVVADGNFGIKIKEVVSRPGTVTKG